MVDLPTIIYCRRYSEPADARAVRLLRICNMPDCGGQSTCGVTALYELGFDCGFQSLTDFTFMYA